MKNKFIEVQFYGDKGAYDGVVGYFKSIDNLRNTWQNFKSRTTDFGSLKDDRGILLTGINTKGYKILTLPLKNENEKL